MSATIALEAVLREKAGKGTSRQTRRDGFVPAVIYGDKKTPVLLSIEKRILDKSIEKHGFANKIIDIKLEGQSFHVLPKAVQFHRVKDTIIHIDFLRVTDKTKLIAHVPVEFINQDICPGLKRGGVLNIVCHSIDLNCEASKIPEKLIVDLAEVNLGDAVHLSNVTLPAGVASTIKGRDFTIATIVAPSALKSEEDSVKQAEATPAAGAAAKAPAAGGKAAPAAAAAPKAADKKSK